MGFVKREYSLYDFQFNTIRRSARESSNYYDTIKSKTVAIVLMGDACAEIKSCITYRQELNCKLLIQTIYNLMDCYANCLGDKPEDFKFLYTPNISGGLCYNLNRTFVNENNTFEFETIQIGIGVNYRGSYSNCVRTILINPPELVINNYNFLQLLQRIIVYNLRDGVKLYKVYEAAISFAKKYPYLETRLEQIFGCILDPKLRNDFVICSNAKSTARYGMIFAINLNLMGLKEEDKVTVYASLIQFLLERYFSLKEISSFQDITCKEDVLISL